MKKTRIIVFAAILILIALPLSAETTPTRTPQTRSQVIGGFVDDIATISVSSVSYGARGINLDYTDESSSYRYNIMPSTQRLSMPGLLIGNFDVYITFSSGLLSGASLTITHDTLFNSPKQFEIDYELAVVYDIYDGLGTTDMCSGYCLSDSNHVGLQLATSSAERRITISLVPSQGRDVCSIHEGGVYFRLAEAFDTIEDGNYTSTVSFILESI